jgi:hypothetical protein
MAEATQLNIVLVHGTWGRGFLPCFRTSIANWCRIESNFVGELRTAILSVLPGVEPTIEPFSWSGRNSVFARKEAAGRLAERLSQLSECAGRTLIISHSHGGNVALNAISTLSDASNLYVCTLATPFLSIFEVNRTRQHSGLLLYIVGALVTWKALYSLSAYSGLDSIVSIPFGALLIWWWLFVSGVKAVYLLLEALLVNPAPQPGQKPTSWQEWPKRIADATPKDTSKLNGRLLVLRGIDDEATLSLATGAVINRITRGMYNFSAFSLFGWGGFAVFVPILIVTKVLESFAPSYSEEFITLTVSALWIVALVTLILASLARMVFGIELAVGAVRCDILFESVPDIDEVEVRTVGVGFRPRGLVHSLHEVPEVPKSIADWLCSAISHSSQR